MSNNKNVCTTKLLRITDKKITFSDNTYFDKLDASHFRRFIKFKDLKDVFGVVNDLVNIYYVKNDISSSQFIKRSKQ